MEAVFNMKIKVTTRNIITSPHRIGDVLKYCIENEIPADAAHEVLEWSIDSYNPRKVIGEDDT